MRGRIAGIIAGVMIVAISVTGCGSAAKKTDKGDMLGRILGKGKITIAMEGTWAPWTYHDENDELTGYDVELGKKIAEKLGVEAEFVEGEWDGLFAGLDTGRYDIVINGVDVTPERSEKYVFSEPYAYIHTVIVTRSDNSEINGFEDLKDKVTANSNASTYMLLAEEYGAKVLGVDSLDETMQMVLSGRADATLNAEVSVGDYLSVHPEAELRIAASTPEANQVAIPMVKGEDTETLRRSIDNAIRELKASGELAELSQKYFGMDLSKE